MMIHQSMLVWSYSWRSNTHAQFHSHTYLFFFTIDCANNSNLMLAIICDEEYFDNQEKIRDALLAIPSACTEMADEYKDMATTGAPLGGVHTTTMNSMSIEQIFSYSQNTK